VVNLHVLDHDHAIGAGGDGRAGHDLDRLSGCDFDCLSGPNILPSTDLADDAKAQAGANISSEAGIAVASGATKGRLVAVRADRLGKNQAQRIEQGSELWRVAKTAGQKLSMFADDAAGVREGDYPRWSWLVQDERVFTNGVSEATTPDAGIPSRTPAHCQLYPHPSICENALEAHKQGN
jgi:hypothetical protein